MVFLKEQKLLKSNKSEVGSRKSEVRSQKSEVRSQKSEVRSQKSEVRSQKSEVRSQKNNQMRKIRILWVFVLYASLTFAQDQKPAFWNDIQSFKKQDSVYYPPKNAILFIGSSSFTMWKDVQKDFPGYKIINRAFGGSSLPDVIRYADDIIVPYYPKQIVIYCGENDFAGSDTVTPQLVFARFNKLFSIIKDQYPDAKVTYISMKPSPSRFRLMPKMLEANLLIKNFLKKKKKTSFVDVYYSMLEADGKPIESIFLADKLHMNASGYAIWQKLIEPHLLK
jgi:lysophospholipase L1-like esterase